MKKIKITITILISIILIKISGTYLLNEIIIHQYNNKKYNTNLIKLIELTNINEPYIVHYNKANILYKQKKYDQAIREYETALERNPKKDRICDIRINLSIATVSNITDLDNEKIKNSLSKAREILYENHCADPNDNSGKSIDAEITEEEIKKLENELEKEDNDNSKNSSNEQNNTEDQKEKDIEEQIKETNKNANRSRQSNLDNYKNMSDYNYYSGKSW